MQLVDAVPVFDTSAGTLFETLGLDFLYIRNITAAVQLDGSNNHPITLYGTVSISLISIPIIHNNNR